MRHRDVRLPYWDFTGSLSLDRFPVESHAKRIECFLSSFPAIYMFTFQFLYRKLTYFRDTPCSGFDENTSAAISLVVAQTWYWHVPTRHGSWSYKITELVKLISLPDFSTKTGLLAKALAALLCWINKSATLSCVMQCFRTIARSDIETFTRIGDMTFFPCRFQTSIRPISFCS